MSCSHTNLAAIAALARRGIRRIAGTFGTSILASPAVKAGASVAIFGTGTVGLAAVMAARIIGADPIIAVDIRPKRLKLAEEVGATHCIENRSIDLTTSIRRITGGGVDHVLEITGDAALTHIGIELLNPGGRLALLTGGRGGHSLPGGRKVLSII